METLLLAIFATIFLATLLNIVFKRYNISHIVGYIFTGTIISYLFDFNTMKIDALDLVGEFGIVFLMFTIGLELSFEKIKKMKDTLLVTRITSYNVCYTKLLRLRSHSEEKDAQKQVLVTEDI